MVSTKQTDLIYMGNLFHISVANSVLKVSPNDFLKLSTTITGLMLQLKLTYHSASCRSCGKKLNGPNKHR